MEAGHGDDTYISTKDQQQQAPCREAGRLPPVVLTSQINQLQLQRQQKGLLKGNFKVHSTRNGTRIGTKEMADFSIICSHFESSSHPNFTFCPKSQKLIKALIQVLPFTTPAENISDGLLTLALPFQASDKFQPPIDHLQKEHPQ
jgi:hypothetical protein